MTHRPVELHLEELVLDGLPFEQRARIAAAIEREWARLLRDAVAAGEAERFERLPASVSLANQQLEVDARWTPERIGQHVARSAFEAFAPKQRTTNNQQPRTKNQELRTKN